MNKKTLMDFKRDLETIAIMGKTSTARKVYDKWKPYIDKRYKKKENEEIYY